jgi:hypothetical protein
VRRSSPAGPEALIVRQKRHALRRAPYESYRRNGYSVSNEELIRRFEDDALPEDSFHHADHVRLAFAYLCQYPALRALEKFSTALKRFAAARGKAQLYNETVTCAYLFLIHERMARCEGADWEEFARRNPELLVWKNGLLDRYYREATLKSDIARRVFVLPDRIS